MPAAQIVRQWILIAALAVSTLASFARADERKSVTVEKGRVDITLTHSEKQSSLPAKIRVSLLLRNPTDKRDTARREFPIAAPPIMQFPQQDRSWCLVAVNEISVPFETKLIVQLHERVQAWPNQQQAADWSERLEKWLAKDKELDEMVKRYRELVSIRDQMSELTETFKDRVERHLIHDDLDYAALNVAHSGPYFGYLVKFMPEVDPTLRIDGKFKRWEYVSLLSDSDPESYRPYEKEWREKSDKWFASKPDLVLLVPKLRELWTSFRKSQELLNGPILKHLHDVNGLSLSVAVQLKSFIERGSNTPPTALVRLLFPEVDAELKKRAAALSKRLHDHSFDESIVSPFTGKLLPQASMPLPFRRTFRNDESVLAELGRPKNPQPFVQRNRDMLTAPMLVSFEAPLEPKSAATIVIEYDAALLPMRHPSSSTYAMGAEEIMAVFPSPKKIPFSVTCPAKLQPIIAPAPQAVASLKEGVRRFDGRLDGEQTMLHVAAINFAKDPHSWVSRFPESDLRIREDLATLIDKADNVAVRPLLMAALYVSKLLNGDAWDAHELTVRIRKDHPDFGQLLDALLKSHYGGRQAKSMHDWVMETGKSPHMKTEEDFNRFKQRSGNDTHMLTSGALKALASRVAKLEPGELTLQEKMGRHFILCEANVERQKNLAAFLKLAEANPREAINALKMLQFLTVEKAAALPYVINQIDLQLRDKARAGKVKTDSFEWIRQNHAYYAMGTFRSPATARQLIEFIDSTEDSLLVQGGIQALSHMTLPDLYEELTGIADHIAASSGSGYIMYLDLLLRSNQKKAVPFIETLRDRYPKYAGYVLRALSRSRVRMTLPQALEVYRTSQDVKGQVGTAISVIHNLAEPKDIAALEYRTGLPDWMNERLVSVIRSKGGDASVFPFVEAYYKEFVQGRKKHNHLTCVRAFERIGDRRAIPYLREIFESTERKRDASEALGNLLLDRRIKRPRMTDNSMDLNIRAVSQPETSEEKRAAAWKELLKTPEKSFARVMVYSALRSALQDSNSEWHEDAAIRLSFISSFGDIAAARLLKESDGCSLHQRYRIAHVLTLLLPGSRELIQKTAKDKSADPDRRLTAQLALKLVRKPARSEGG